MTKKNYIQPAYEVITMATVQPLMSASNPWKDEIIGGNSGVQDY